MIKANELRIGNLIIDDDGALAKVIGFKPYEHSVRCDEEEGCDVLIDIYGADGKIRRGYAVESTIVNPIPLTPEWLERCGFEKVQNGLALPVLEGYVEIASLYTGFSLTLEIDGNRMPLHKIKFLHQLQNLYLSLTGEELNVKL